MPFDYFVLEFGWMILHFKIWIELYPGLLYET